MNILKLKKKVEQKKTELQNLSNKFRELKSLVYDYRDIRDIFQTSQHAHCALLASFQKRRQPQQ